MIERLSQDVYETNSTGYQICFAERKTVGSANFISNNKYVNQ